MVRDPSDYWFELEPVKSFSAIAEGFSVLRPLCGRFDQKFLDSTLLNLGKHWRMRLQALHLAGWQAIQSEKYAYARNCRPCSCKVTPAKAQPCHLRICPFCHARLVGRTYTRARQLVEARRDKGWPVSVVSFSKVFPLEDAPRFCDSDDLAAQLLQEIVPQQLDRRSRYRQHCLDGALGDCHWFAIEPVVTGINTGAWQVRHGNLAIVAADWQPKYEFDELHVRTMPTGRQLAYLTARAFRYPKTWMVGNEGLVATMLNVTAGVRCFTRTGIFRGTNE